LMESAPRPYLLLRSLVSSLMTMMMKMVSDFLSCINHRAMEHQPCPESIFVTLNTLSFYGILSVIFPLALSCAVFTSVIGLVYLRLERSVCTIVPSNCVCSGVQTSMHSEKLRFGRFICIVAPNYLFE
jgi:hypothetical protein